jgi:hypothetical protein
VTEDGGVWSIKTSTTLKNMELKFKVNYLGSFPKLLFRTVGQIGNTYADPSILLAVKFQDANQCIARLLLSHCLMHYLDHKKEKERSQKRIRKQHAYCSWARSLTRRPRTAGTSPPWSTSRAARSSPCRRRRRMDRRAQR